MSRLPSRRIVAAALLLLAVACGDQPRTTTPRPPDERPSAALLTTSCQRADYDYLNDNVATVFAADLQRSVSATVRGLRQTCPDTGAMLDFVQQIVGWQNADLANEVTPVTGYAVRLPAADGPTWDYLTRLFKYHKYSLPNTRLALGRQGFIRVCDDNASSDDCIAAAPAKTGGIRIYDGALGGRYLVTGAPASCATVSTISNLKTWAQCLEISVDPKEGSTFDFLTSPGAVVQTCIRSQVANAEYLWTGAYTGSGPALGKVGRLAEVPTGATRAALLALAPAEEQPIPTSETDCDAATSEGQLASLHRGSGLFGRALAGLGALFMPKVAYAGHGGLGTLPGFTDGLSLFGPVDPFLFQATFEAQTAGAPLTSGTLGDRDRGFWSISTDDPSAVTVQTGIGTQYTWPNKLLVINQAGGASGRKTGVRALAIPAQQTAQPQYAIHGLYRIRWTAIIGSNKAFDATYVVQDATGRRFATLVFGNGTSAGSGPLTFNGVQVATWTQLTPVRYEILLDLDNDKVRFGIVQADGSTTYLTTLQNTPSPKGVELAAFGWVITGVDAQIIGTDEMEVVRLPDP